MPISLFGLTLGGHGQPMAKKVDINEERVQSALDSLVAAGCDRAQFEVALQAIKDNEALTSAEIQTVAQRYFGGGKRPTSRQGALSLIVKRFTEIVRGAKSVLVAERSRPL